MLIFAVGYCNVMKEPDFIFDIISDFYASHRDRLVGFATRYLNNRQEAEDIVQDAFLRLLRCDKMISEVTLPGLAHAVVKRLVYDLLRHRQAVAQHEHYLKSTGTAVEPTFVYEAREMMEIMEKGEARLTRQQRIIYRMNVDEGMKVAEISTRLQMKYKSVEYNLGTARKQMRDYVKRMLA
jgi:RNA polymerase sigma-70 factor (ECF subfamily)